MSTFDLLADLPLEVEGYALEGLRAQVSSGFERLTTVVHLHGGGARGRRRGRRLRRRGPRRPPGGRRRCTTLAGRYTLGEFCELIDSLDLFPVAPQREVSRLYRRWTFHSAALDLALRQAGQPLHEVLGREPQPLTFVVSLRLGEPPTIEPIERRLARYPTLRFKLDPTSSWTPELIAALVATGAVDSVDFKSLYRGTSSTSRPTRCSTGGWSRRSRTPGSRTPTSSPPTPPRCSPTHHDRITWDAPIHSIADIEALPFPPRMVNIKPSRIGGLGRLCATYDYCAEHGIGAYGGGQFELGPGAARRSTWPRCSTRTRRTTSRPSGYNQDDPPPGLPSSPLPPAPSAIGFRWGAA